MNRTIDATVFILLPAPEDRKKIEGLISGELCEVFILDRVEIVRDLLVQMEKSILVIDRETLPPSVDPVLFADELLSACGEKLIRVFIVGDNPPEGRNPKITSIKREILGDDKKVIGIIDELQIWGMRNYIRFGNHKSRIAFFRMKFGGRWRTGVIHDISASGMSCSFDRFDDIDVSAGTTAIELCIKESIFRLTGNFLIRRTFKNSNMFVLVFSRKRGGDHIRRLNSIIYKLVRESVLEKIEKLA